MEETDRVMKIWITGSAGFLGARLMRELRRAGHDVLGMARRAATSEPNTVIIDLAAETAPAQLKELLEETGPPDYVVHAASRQPGPYTMGEYVRGNVMATANLADALRACPPERFLYTSTLSVYGRQDLLPAPETAPLLGESAYARTKRWGEQAAETLQDRTQVVVLRLPSLYGVGQGGSFIDDLAQAALCDQPIALYGRGEVIRDTLHVTDVVCAIEHFLTMPLKANPVTLNLGCGERRTAYDHALALVTALESRSEIVLADRPSPQQDMVADITRARRNGFRPAALEESLTRYAHELRARS